VTELQLTQIPQFDYTEVTRTMRIFRTKHYEDWFLRLKDYAGRTAINRRLIRMEQGNPGNVRSVGSGVMEMKIDFGPGYRVYYIQQAEIAVILLCGGDKSSQGRDIALAKEFATRQEIQALWHSI
jgi:putative addiction module killer protein